MADLSKLNFLFQNLIREIVFNDLFFVVVAPVAPVPAALVCVWCDDFGTIL